MKSLEKYGKFGKIGLNNWIISKSQKGLTEQDVRKGKRFCWLVTLNANTPLKPLVSRRRSIPVSRSWKLLESLIDREVTVTGLGKYASLGHSTYFRYHYGRLSRLSHLRAKYVKSPQHFVNFHCAATQIFAEFFDFVKMSQHNGN